MSAMSATRKREREREREREIYYSVSRTTNSGTGNYMREKI